MREPLFAETLQISIVVRDLDAAMRAYVARFLATNGPSVHHVGVGVRSYDCTIAELAGGGQDILLGGEYNGVKFSYLSTDRDLGVITEIFDAPPGLEQKPDAIYPPPEDAPLQEDG